MLDWIFQVSRHGFPEPTVSGLVNALSDVMDPQANLCSNGQNKKLTKADVARLVKEYGRQAA
jgi:hypothetical protein